MNTDPSVPSRPIPCRFTNYVMYCEKYATARVVTILPLHFETRILCDSCLKIHLVTPRIWKQTTIEQSFLFPFSDRYATIWK